MSSKTSSKSSNKFANAQSHRLILYRRPLHPELFNLASRRTDRHGEYECDTWLFPGGHLVRFNFGKDLATEVVLDTGDHLPEAGLVHALPCVGEKDYEADQPIGRIQYVTSLQTETLADNLYQSTYQEMLDFAEETGSVCLPWEDEDGGRCLSLVDSQKYKREFHVQSYHLVASSGFVLRTQSIFEIVD